MKLIKETLYEKFVKNSDPISDMGIGAYPKKIKKLRKILQDKWDENFEQMERYGEDRGQAIDIIEEIQIAIDNLFGEE